MLAMERFHSKKGKDLEAKVKLIQQFNVFTKSNTLKAIYVNCVDNALIPDVYVLPSYYIGIGNYLTSLDYEFLNGNKYTIEIHERCFDKYTAEELTAIIIYHIIQNVLSNTAKSRFLTAYTCAVDKYGDKAIMKVFASTAYDEIAYMIFMDICARPLHAPKTENNETPLVLISSDDILKAYNIYDIYYGAINNNGCSTGNLLEDGLKRELDKDSITTKTIIDMCIEGEIVKYYNELKCTLKMISIDNIKNFRNCAAAIGSSTNNLDNVRAVNESFINPTNDTELQFKIDKIVTSMKYAESEDERAALLFKIKTLRLKLIKLKNNYTKQNPQDNREKAELKAKIEVIDGYLFTIDKLRVEVINLEIVPKRYGVFIKYPEGYDY